jgi:D-arabinose 1-dehydrogenase-like Zn-dependent alcohol dehydrogenase
MRPEDIASCVPGLLDLIGTGAVKIFARNSYSLDRVTDAFEALSSRQTIGKVVLTP